MTLQRRFIASRCMMRQLLANNMAGVTAREIQFAYGQHGKPFLVSPPQICQQQTQSTQSLYQSDIYFNLSHSQQYALFAIAATPIGIDIEYQCTTDRKINVLALAKRFFTVDEYKWLQNKTDHAQQDAFFYLWTRKEAIVKASGDGIANTGWSKVSCLAQKDKDIACSVLYKEQKYTVIELDIERDLAVICYAAVAISHSYRQQVLPSIRLHSFYNSTN